MLQKKNEGIPFSAEIRVVGSYTDRLLKPNRDIKNCFEFILLVINYQSDRSESVLVLKVSFTLRIDFD